MASRNTAFSSAARFVLAIGLLTPYAPACLAEDSPPATTSGPGAPANPAGSLATVNDYDQELDKLKADLGPYDPRLGEQLLSLGLVYQRLARYPDAIAALKQSLYIKRINDGLQSMSQVPVLDKLIETNILAQHWDDLDQNYEQLLWVHRRNFGNGDPQLLPILDKIGRWKLKAYAEHLLKENPSATIDEAAKLYGHTVDILTKQLGELDPRLIDPLYGSALANYQMMVELASRPISEFKAAGPAVLHVRTVQTICSQVSTRAGPRTQCSQLGSINDVPNVERMAQQQQEKDFEIHQHYSAAGKSLERIVAIHDAHPELSRDSLANALVNYGDWNMLSGSIVAGMGAYKRAIQLLSAGGANQDAIDAYFGSPRQLPALRLPLPKIDEQVEKTRNQDYVLATVDVDANGKAHNVEIVEASNPDNMSIRRKAKDRLRMGVYRPRFENGEAVETTGVKVRYVDAP